MKTYLKLIMALALAAFAFTATAQIGSPGIAVSPGYINSVLGTNIIPAGATNGNTLTNIALIDCSKGKELALGLSFGASAATSQALFFTFEQGVDGSHWTNSFTWNPLANGTTPVTAITNITVNGLPWVRVTKIYNSNSAAAITNLYLRYYVK